METQFEAGSFSHADARSPQRTVDCIYDISPHKVEKLTETDMMLGVGAGKRDAEGSVNVRRFVARYKMHYQHARKARASGPGDSKQDIVVRIVLGLKTHGYRILGPDMREVAFDVAYDKVWKLVRDTNRLILSENERAKTLDDLPSSPGRENMYTYVLSPAEKDNALVSESGDDDSDMMDFESFDFDEDIFAEDTAIDEFDKMIDGVFDNLKEDGTNHQSEFSQFFSLGKYDEGIMYDPKVLLQGMMEEL